MTDADPQPGDHRDEPVEPPLRDQILAQMGGWTGMVYSSLPVIAFVPANALWGLTWGAVAALIVAAVILVIRLATRTSVQPAISGFLGVGVCVLIAFAVGSGKGYFLYGIVVQALMLVAFVVSLLVRRPLVGVLWHTFGLGVKDEGARDESAKDEGAEDEGAEDEGAEDEGGSRAGRDWRSIKRELYTFDALTVLWSLMFGARFVVQGLLYSQGRTGWLGVTRIAMGWPLLAVCVGATYLGARWAAGTRHPAPDGVSGPAEERRP
ncbi:DUF3159 domain-containing protein [Tsukamurella soli]|uniref:DUF3159 domain-containing protein n=1 Tax=Tsukamurella soli TaxID=644556 RepID=A0ABP8JIP3_9ACTN